MNKFLVTGGAGFIGSHVVELLVEQGFEVNVLDNMSTGSHNINLLEDLDVRVFVGDISKSSDIETASQDVDAIIHLAAMNRAPRSIENPSLSNKVNITGTVNILEYARKHDLKVSFASSSSVFGDLEIQPRPERTNTFKPPHPYGLGKLTSERYISLYRELYGLDAITIRYFSVYGPRQSPKITYSAVIPRFISLILKGQPITIHGGDQTRNFTFVKDTARATVLLSTSETIHEVYNIGGEETVSINKLAQNLIDISGKDVEIKRTGFRQGDIMNSIPSMDNLKSELKFTHNFSVQEGLKETYKWISTHPKYFD